MDNIGSQIYKHSIMMITRLTNNARDSVGWGFYKETSELIDLVMNQIDEVYEREDEEW